MQQKQSQKQSRQSREKEKKLEEERAKIYSAPIDTCHYRLLVLGLIDEYTLAQTLKLNWNNHEKIVTAVNELTREECIVLLLHNAVEHVLTASGYYGRDDATKKWIVKEWHLTSSLFLKEDNSRSSEKVE
jgi:hypothetical protein